MSCLSSANKCVDLGAFVQDSFISSFATYRQFVKLLFDDTFYFK